jgi:PmbA protein
MEDKGLAATRRIAEWTIREARRRGADEAAAEVSHDAGLSVTVRMGKAEAVEHTEERVLTLSVWVGHRRGAASTADLSEGAIAQAVQAAVDIARATEKDPCAGLPDERDLQTEFRELDLWHPFEGGADEAIAYAARAEEAAMHFDERIVNSEGTQFDTSSGAFTLANTLGFSAGYRYSRHDLDVAPLAQDESGMERDGWSSQGRDLRAMPSPEAVGRKAAERTVARLGAAPMGSRRARVLFDANASAGLLDVLEELMSGSAWYRNASFLKGRLGERILPPFVSVKEEPYIKGGLGSGVFDDEGCAAHERLVIEEGRLRGLFLTSYSARRLGMRTSGNAGGAYKLTLESSETRPEDSFEAMLARLGTGMLVTELIGQGVNAVTGDYSRGFSGFWVESGRIAAPVEGMTIAGNLARMMRSIEAVGADVLDDGCRRTGSILIPDLTLAGED